MEESKDSSEGIWVEDQEMSPEAKAMSDVIRKMKPVDRAVAVLDMLAHDDVVMEIVRSRMVWEIRNFVIKGMKEGNSDDEIMMHKILGSILSKECDDNMRVAFP